MIRTLYVNRLGRIGVALLVSSTGPEIVEHGDELGWNVRSVLGHTIQEGLRGKWLIVTHSRPATSGDLSRR